MEEKKMGKPLFYALIILILMAVVAWSAYRAGQEKQEEEVSGIQRELDAELGILPGMSDEEIQDRLNRKVAESRLNISMNRICRRKSGRRRAY